MKELEQLRKKRADIAKDILIALAGEDSAYIDILQVKHDEIDRKIKELEMNKSPWGAA